MAPYRCDPLGTLNTANGASDSAAGRLFDIFTACLDDGRRMGRNGGPLGGDFHLALELDWLVREYTCDALIETGTFEGDSTGYLARAYPDVPVWTCENDASLHRRARERLAGLPNVTCVLGSSPDFVKTAQRFARPLYFLDAHWDRYWPLLDELAAIQRGVICIHDFDVGHPACGYDFYAGQACGPGMVAAYRPIHGNRVDADCQPVENRHPGIFQPRQVRSEAPHGSQNNDLRRYFGIASLRCRSLLTESTGCYLVARRPVHRIGRGYLVIGLENRLDEMPYARRLL